MSVPQAEPQQTVVVLEPREVRALVSQAVREALGVRDCEYLTPAAAAAYLGIGTTALASYRVTGGLRAVVLPPVNGTGARPSFRYRRQDLDRWAAAHLGGGK